MSETPISIKAVSRSVSLSEDLWDLADEHANTNGGRSEYFRKLVTDDLDKAGKLPGTNSAELYEELAATAEIVGHDRVRATLKRLRNTAAKEKAIA